jgi:subtilase family serine protease
MVHGLAKRVLLGATILSAIAGGAPAASLPASPPLVASAVDDSVTVTLPRDLPGALAHARDAGVMDAGTKLPHIRLELQRPPALQAALDTLTRNQTTRGSAEYHQWLKPADLRQYGPAQSDIDKVTAWLTRHGLTVNEVARSGMSIDFGGTAAQVAAAFHTEMHNVSLGGEAHVANISAPSIPAALLPVVTGVTLANFFPRPASHRVVPNFTANTPDGTFYAVTPQDFATIYNVNPLRSSNNFYGAPITGTGVTLAVVEQTLIRANDWTNFRNKFGLGGYAGTLTQIHPGGCKSPGFTGDEVEAAIDSEWSSAVAPDAAIIEASCATRPPLNFGVETSLQKLVEQGTTATIFSISYEGDEIADGYAFEEGWTKLLQEGAAEGIAIFVAAGDNGTSADRNQIDSDGLFVNGLADSAYNVSVGGTDFYDTALGEDSTYWRAKNRKYGDSALSYVPEIPWDNSCASSILWKFQKAANAIALCNSNFNNDQNGVGGSGSQSVYYKKPSWQLLGVPGMPRDGVRDQPDVSLFAANGLWAHFYLECMSDVKEGGAPCDYSNANDLFDSAYGGTSFGAPDFAGIAALIQEVMGAPLGNPAPELYLIAKAQFRTPLGLSQCNATLGNKISSACVFYDVTAGDNAEACNKGTTDCLTSPAATMGIGVLATTVNNRRVLAYPAHAGYSLATGLGSVNVTNLLYNY